MNAGKPFWKMSLPCLRIATELTSQLLDFVLHVEQVVEDLHDAFVKV